MPRAGLKNLLDFCVCRGCLCVIFLLMGKGPTDQYKFKAVQSLVIPPFTPTPVPGVAGKLWEQQHGPHTSCLSSCCLPHRNEIFFFSLVLGSFCCTQPAPGTWHSLLRGCCTPCRDGLLSNTFTDELQADITPTPALQPPQPKRALGELLRTVHFSLS